MYQPNNSAEPIQNIAAPGQMWVPPWRCRASAKDEPPTIAPLNNRYAASTIPVFSRWIGSWQISVQRKSFSSSQLACLYDQAAPSWGRTLDRFGFPRAYESMLRRVLSELPLKDAVARPRVVDCGVGTGALSCALAHVLPHPFTLDAIDVSPRMLEWASRNLTRTDLEFFLRQGDICSLPYAHDVYDVAMAAHVLEHLVDPRAALAEMVRVLKPGGLLIACITRRSALGKLVHLKWRTHLVSPDEASRWLTALGLEDVRCLSFNESPLCRRMSVVWVGRKPSNANLPSDSIR